MTDPTTDPTTDTSHHHLTDLHSLLFLLLCSQLLCAATNHCHTHLGEVSEIVQWLPER